MPAPLVNLHIGGAIATIALNDPDRRNALGLPMFDSLDEAIARLRDDDEINVVIVRGEGSAFCAGFDLGAAVDEPAVFGTFIGRLSVVLRSLRRLPQPVVASVHGAALAGGCAMLSACDFVCASPGATMGYPVHALGVSPAVTLPTLMRIIGDDPARALVMTGRVIDGVEAKRIGLVSHLSASDAQVHDDATALARRLADHGRRALRITKQWMNELDGSLDDDRFNAPARGSTTIVEGDEAAQRLRSFWAQRQRSTEAAGDGGQ